jgi:ATP synthase protein I
MADRDHHDSEQKLADIHRRLDKLQAERNEQRLSRRAAFPQGAAAMVGRVATELVAGVIVGAFMGWVLDRWLETSPLFLVVMFFLGAIAGMLNVWRFLTGRGMAAGYFDERKSPSDDVNKGADRQ